MSESFIEPDSLNTIFQSLSAIIDDDGATRFLNQELSSYNFDGFIPIETDTIKVNQLKPGDLFLPVGESTGTLRAALKVEFDDPEMTDFPTSNYIISYLGPNGDIQTVTYDSDDDIEVYFEDWDNKILGNTGWIITQAGNAIFSNVAVRGRIEAQEGFLENLGITGTLTMEAGGTINIGTDPGTPGNAGIVINESGIFAYDDNETSTFSIDAATGEIIIGALDEAIENIEEELENFVTPEDLVSGSYVTNAKLVDGVTRISGTNIQTGTVNANLVNVVNINAGNINTGTINAITFQTDFSGRRSRLSSGNAYVPTNWSTTIIPRSGGTGNTSYLTTGMEFFDQNSQRTGYLYSADRYNSGTFQPNQRLLVLGTTDSSGLDTGNEIIIGHNYIRMYAEGGPPLDIRGEEGVRLYGSSNTGVNIGSFGSDDVYIDGQSILFSQGWDGVYGNSPSAIFYTNIYAKAGYKYFGDGSGLTGVGSPIVVQTVGPSSPSLYADDTVWYVV